MGPYRGKVCLGFLEGQLIIGGIDLDQELPIPDQVSLAGGIFGDNSWNLGHNRQLAIRIYSTYGFHFLWKIALHQLHDLNRDWFHNGGGDRFGFFFFGRGNTRSGE